MKLYPFVLSFLLFAFCPPVCYPGFTYVRIRILARQSTVKISFVDTVAISDQAAEQDIAAVLPPLTSFDTPAAETSQETSSASYGTPASVPEPSWGTRPTLRVSTPSGSDTLNGAAGETEILIPAEVKTSPTSCDTSTTALPRNKVLAKPGSYSITPVSSGMRIVRTKGEPAFSLEASPEVRIESRNNGRVLVNGREYRGDIHLKKRGDSSPVLDVINVLSVEDYIRGTIKSEVSHKWPQDAIKAHIVAARTYALKQMQNSAGRDFDMGAGVLSQVYWGCEGEDTATDELVRGTAGEYLSYRGEIAQVFYHSCCGGYTEDAVDVWGLSVPYLVFRRCAFCKGSPRYFWEKKFKIAKIQDSLSRGGVDVGRIINLWWRYKSRSGRIVELGIKGSKGVRYLSGAEFRRLMGYNKIPSTMFTIHQRVSGEFIFKGRGWGHGVGMCQWGAKGMALNGYSYREILQSYYPGTKIQVMDYDTETVDLAGINNE